MRSWNLPLRPKFETSLDADEYVDELKVYYRTGGPPKVRTRISIVDMIALYLEDSAGLSPYTIRNYTRTLEEFGGFCKNRRWVYLDEIEAEQFGAYQRMLKALGNSQNTRAGKEKYVVQMFNAAVKYKYITSVPFADAVTRKNGKQANRAFARSEVTAVQQFDGKRGPLWRLLFALGARRREIAKLSAADFVFDAIPYPHVKLEAKGKARTVPMSPEVVALAKAFIEAAPAMRHTQGASRKAVGLHDDIPDDSLLGVVAQTLDQWWRADRELMGMPDATLHTFRHNFITSIGDIKAAQVLAGHADIQTTAGYDHPDQDRLVAAVQRVAVTPVSLTKPRKKASR